MGQQQLLLLVLGIVIVGLAVVVGIEAFSENRTKSNADALVTDALRIASDAQAWALKPAQFGGGSEAGLAAATFSDIGYPLSGSSTEYTNVNGKFGLGTSAPSDAPSNCSSDTGNSPVINVYAYNTDTGNCIVVGLAGTSADDIATEVAYGS